MERDIIIIIIIIINIYCYIYRVFTIMQLKQPMFLGYSFIIIIITIIVALLNTSISPYP